MRGGPPSSSACVGFGNRARQALVLHIRRPADRRPRQTCRTNAKLPAGPVENRRRHLQIRQTRTMSGAEPLPQILSQGSFTLAAGRANGQSPSRLKAKDLRTPSRGIRVPVGVPQPWSARIRPYQELSPGCVVSDATAGLLFGTPLPAGLDGFLHLSSTTSRSGPRRKNVIGHSRALESDEVARSAPAPGTLRTRPRTATNRPKKDFWNLRNLSGPPDDYLVVSAGLELSPIRIQPGLRSTKGCFFA